jgi:hypothetical protein
LRSTKQKGINTVINIGNVGAVRHDANDVAKLRRELRNAGLDERYHEAAIAGCRAAGILNDVPDSGDVADGRLHAGAEDTRKARLARLNAAKENPTTRSNVVLLEGLLKRGGVTLDAILDADLAKIDAVFAASRLTVGDRLAAKSLLHQYGCL